MFNIARSEFEIEGKKYFLETGKLALQAEGSVVCGCGDTWVLCTAVYAKNAKAEASFFPLTVNYIEKFSAFGKIPGGYLKRESKPSDKETLLSRLIDRPLRPMFPENFYNEVQVTCTLLSYDKENDPDMLALIGASAAVRMAGLPIIHTIAGAKIGFIDGNFVVNPSVAQIADKTNKLDLIVAGTKNSVLMVESEAHELSEEQMLEAVLLGQKAGVAAINAIEDLYSKAGKAKLEVAAEAGIITETKAKIKAEFGAKIQSAYEIPVKKDRYSKLDEIRSEISAKFASEVAAAGIPGIFFENAISTVEADMVRNNIVANKKRIDGRKEDEVRKLYTEISVMPRTHGSALFMRGETQALVTTTLGSATDTQMSDGIDGLMKDKFMLHYNFPGFSVNEVAPMRGPGRREIGHGKLALRAIRPMLDLENCPYTIRVVSDIISCNGSSSMATICGASLSLMDAGVMLKKPVAGIAMGLVKQGEDFTILTDIMADEDFLGDMDFKVAGTGDGITALQMDIKIDGISREILTKALDQAKAARLHILAKMNETIDRSKDSVNKFAPKIVAFNIPVNSIGDVIGKGGANIKQLCEDYSCKIEISEAGAVTVFAENEEKAEGAREAIIFAITDLEVGQMYVGTVVELKGFGAMVKLPGNKQGMIHISEVADHRIEDINDYISVGDVLNVKYLGTDEKRRVKLSAKSNGLKNRAAAQKAAEPIANDSDDLIDKRFSSESSVEMLANGSVYSN